MGEKEDFSLSLFSSPSLKALSGGIEGARSFLQLARFDRNFQKFWNADAAKYLHDQRGRRRRGGGKQSPGLTPFSYNFFAGGKMCEDGTNENKDRKGSSGN